MAAEKRSTPPGACFEGTDRSVISVPASMFTAGVPPRDPQPTLLRLANQLAKLNGEALRRFGATAAVRTSANGTFLDISTGTTIGALPLLSPTTARPDYGLVIRPRFEWRGIGPMMGDMGFRVVPSILPLPALPRSDRSIPQWVLSSVVLPRIERLLRGLNRQFEMRSDLQTAPKGRVDWGSWATQHLSRGAFLRVPCTYPALQEDRRLLAGLHYTLRLHLDSLESQRSAGSVVVHLVDFCRNLIGQVSHVAPAPASAGAIAAWVHGRLQSPGWADGVEAIEWAAERRGLAGMSDLRGIPWQLEMEEFFEAWVETVVSRLAPSIGARVQAGRLRQTQSPLQWEPPYEGSQRYLLPDVVMQRDDVSFVFDAKYKQHWEELNSSGWTRLEEIVKERHRTDLLQVLAYSTLFSTPKVVCVLVYPCRRDTWESLKSRGRLVHRASVASGHRDVSLLLTAVPFGVTAREAADTLAEITVSVA